MINKEKHGKETFFRFIGISTIKNNTKRRIALITSFPFLFFTGCALMLPLIVYVFCSNNIKLIETFIIRWNEPLVIEKDQE